MVETFRIKDMIWKSGELDGSREYSLYISFMRYVYFLFFLRFVCLLCVYLRDIDEASAGQ